MHVRLTCDHDLGGIVNRLDSFGLVSDEWLTGACRIVEAKHERMELMAGRHAVECQAGGHQHPRIVTYHDADQRGGKRQWIVHIEFATPVGGDLTHLVFDHVELAVAQAHQFSDERLEIGRGLRLVELQLQCQRPRHA